MGDPQVGRGVHFRRGYRDAIDAVAQAGEWTGGVLKQNARRWVADEPVPAPKDVPAQARQAYADGFEAALRQLVGHLAGEHVDAALWAASRELQDERIDLLRVREWVQSETTRMMDEQL